MDWSRVLTDGAVLSVVASVLIFGSLRANPRIWLQDFPQDIREAVPPKTAAERRQSLVWGIPFLTALLAVPTISTLLFKRQHPSAATYSALFLNAFGVEFLFNTVDLIIIDWLVLCWMTPRSFVIPGTEGLAGYKNYRHHFRGFVIGTLFSGVLGLLVATFAYFA